ncbi:hypothetical protein H072_9019 [Dactylellina haptotyla CBS 200.50]|uniref:Apple domain-containing protein n=1 Tax=Dactylellina haptotyla (strain CBS 200.50) TaxID=1284197 RepID=S8A3G4_DACHA|nr:hypothetical protein H072_9019 [Dactylellina haptotyla CBS 200.50]
MAVKTFFLLAALTVGSQAQDVRFVGNGPLTKRADGCDSDNLLRNFRDKRYSASASDFCSAWLQSTITNTLSVTATVDATATETPVPNTATLSETVTITNTETTLTTDYPTAVNTFAKRGSDVPYPGWLAATFPPVRVSSACSCFIPSPSPVVVLTATTTVATQTNTATTTLEPLTNTVTTLITQTASATATQVITGESIPCGATGCSNGIGYLGYSDDATTLTACKDFCKSSEGCLTFQFGSTADYTICHIFETPLADTYATGESTDGLCTPYKFYDVRCVV